MYLAFFSFLMNPRWLLMSALACALCPCACSMSCSLSCICVFEDNSASCEFNKSKLEVTWHQNGARAISTIMCTNAFKDLQYDCAEFPQFDISNDVNELNTCGCAPSVLRCIPKLYQQRNRIAILDSVYMVGAYTAEDYVGLKEAEKFIMVLAETETVEVIHFAPSFTYCTITGGIVRLSPNLFQTNNLQYLYINNNKIEEIPPNSFIGLPNLKGLQLYRNYIKNLAAETFIGLDALEDLTIENCRIFTIDANAFSPLKQLNLLNIEYNKLKLVPNGLFARLDNLYRVRFVTNQNEIKLDTHASANLPTSIKVVDMSNSKVKHLPEYLFEGSTNIHQLYFIRNQIEALPPKLFETNTGLIYVDFKDNRINELPVNIFAALKRLEHIDLTCNLITSLNGELFTHSSGLKEVYLNHNQISSMDRDIFNGTKLKILTLAYNRLQRIPGDFFPGWSTKNLNLSHNKLEVFEDWFIQLNDLEKLDLSYNEIKMLKESHIYKTKTKITIDLRNNNITRILRDVTNTKESLAPIDVTLYLSNNPLECDGIVFTILKGWHKKGILADFESIVTMCANKEKQLKLETSKTNSFISLVGSSVIGTFIALLVLIYLFTSRNEIWASVSNVYASTIFIFNFKNSDINSQIFASNDLEMEGETEKPFDLFVSFAHQDSEFVTDKLLPILEIELNLKVCVHYRDWVVGDLISDQIKESVESSTMTMIVLTEHFLLSEWSNLEFHTAHNLSIEDGKPRLIIILLDEALSRHKQLSFDIKSYLDVNTYLLWEDIYFWEKLQKILPRKKKSKRKYFH